MLLLKNLKSPGRVGIGTLGMLGLLFFGPAPHAHAQVNLTFTYDGSSTSLDYSVAANTFSGLTFQGNITDSNTADIFNGGVYIAIGSYARYDTASDVASAPWSSFATATLDPGSDNFLLNPVEDWLGLPVGFNLVSDTLSGRAVWSGSSPIDLGFSSNDSASASYSAGGATVNWSVVNTTAVPEPSTYASLVGLLSLVIVGCRRKRRE